MIQIYLIPHAWQPASETFASSAMTTPTRQVWSALIRIADETLSLEVTAHDRVVKHLALLSPQAPAILR
jgi:hypothetical protein